MNSFLYEYAEINVEYVFGLLVMSLVVFVNIYTFLEITLAYRRSMEKREFKSRHLELLRFIAYLMALVVAQLASLSIWAAALYLPGFVKDWMAAVMLTASFFTSVGNFTVNLPMEWRLIPSLIAFTGMFSFAWATTATFSMAHTLGKFLDENKAL